MQLGWARQHGLPVVIHCRAAFAQTMQVLQSHGSKPWRGIWHCFGGTLAEAQQIIAMGFHLGIGGVLTFNNAGLGKVLEQVALEHLVLETDSPYLAPAPHRGQRNEPAHLVLVAQRLAAIKQVPWQAVAQATTANAATIFAL